MWVFLKRPSKNLFFLKCNEQNILKSLNEAFTAKNFFIFFQRLGRFKKTHIYNL